MSDSRSSNRRSQWDVGRFLSTLGYFGEIPFLGSFRWLQQLAGQRTNVAGFKVTAAKRIAFVGDLSPELLDALDRRLSPDGEVIAVSLNAPSFDLTRLVQTVDTIVVLDFQALEARVLELGYPSVQQFWNALLFEDELDETGVNFEKLKQSVFDFTDPSCDLSAWGALDDVVMGGVSQGGFFLKYLEQSDEASKGRTQSAVFAGNISTENSGGFSSVRTKNFEPPFDFFGWTGMRLRVKGDGKRYKFILRNSDAWDSPAYIYSFDTNASEWREIYVPFEDMVPTFRARSMPDAVPLDPRKVFSIQIMLSKFEYDKRLNPEFSSGPFELLIAEIDVYRPRKGVPLFIVTDDEAAWAQQQASLEALSTSSQSISVEASADDEARAEAIARALL